MTTATETPGVAWLVIYCVAVLGSARAAEPFGKKTYTYKTVDEVAIQADVYRPGDDKVRPAVIWIHGGALIVGSRRDVPTQLLDLCKREGFLLVSLDYRLAPEVKLPAIAEDIRDAFRWLRKDGPRLFHIDPDRVVVTGGSAGGYLTLLVGSSVTPRPKALVAYWGYGDVDGPWYTTPSAYYRKSPLLNKDKVSRAVGGKVLTGTTGDTGQARGLFYRYLPALLDSWGLPADLLTILFGVGVLQVLTTAPAGIVDQFPKDMARLGRLIKRGFNRVTG